MTYLVHQVMRGGLGRVGLLLNGFFDSNESVSRSRYKWGRLGLKGLIRK